MQLNNIQEAKPVHNYLIIGGAPKAATTSLFNYLADHPEICPSNRKETYFFARDFDYQNVCTSNKTLEAFENYFTHYREENKWKIEATPYTLYADDAAQTIAALLQNVSMLFILRDPVDRMFSNYQMRKQRQTSHSHNTTFEEFVDGQLKDNVKLPNSLMLGCYIKYLRPFYDVFGRDKIIILFIEELMANPTAELQKLCVHLGIDENFYSNYSFNVYNKSINPRFAILNKAYIGLEPIVANMRRHIMSNPRGYKLFESSLRAGKSLFRRLNNPQKKTKETILPKTNAKLADYYRPYTQALEKEIGRPLPWKSFEANSKK